MKKDECKHDPKDVIPQAYFSYGSEGEFSYIPYLVLMCVGCDEYFIEKGVPMVKEDE